MTELPPSDPAVLGNDERMFGLLSHLSIFFGGILLPIVFWAINKDKSKFATFHSLQALFFHLFFLVVILGSVFFIAFGAIGINIFTFIPGRGHQGMPLFFLIFIFAAYALMFVLAFGCMAYSVYMGIKAYQGNLNKYPIIGKIVYGKVYGV